MGLGRAGGHHHPVEFFFGDDFSHVFLGVLGAGIQIVGGKFHIGQGGGIFGDRRHIHYAGDVGAAVADKHTDAGPFVDHVRLGNLFFLLDPGVARAD